MHQKTNTNFSNKNDITIFNIYFRTESGFSFYRSFKTRKEALKAAEKFKKRNNYCKEVFIL